MNDKYILTDNHEAVEESDLMKWAKWLDTADRKVAKTKLKNDVRVSTVFLGLDHSYKEGPPLLFETMVFGGKHDGDMERYSTWQEAVRGHERIVRRLRNE